ncbi:hypothetical protein ACL02S_18300 [Nocardia sp. 004]|uniref:hypothetical protein n=1 Tax=Nocardia sp. 004 TaxID=3385978 RepID=UPI0039A034D5
MSSFTRINQSRSPLLYLAVGALLLMLIVGAGLVIANGDKTAAAGSGAALSIRSAHEAVVPVGG